ncbi:hypothetical protein EST38_g7640 [Candolleomyces aberdarensis]|uniref:Uncharacterized protein n=1 Tax=Candolleomyces aberdarensis TaxID=2316362 RepID=A0A4Q2DHG2_9AGAR|nr:hypothetical protein EST38_g7640 [Candolleomyces aberdarensis]
MHASFASASRSNTHRHQVVLDGLVAVLPELHHLSHFRLCLPVCIDLRDVDEDILDTDYALVRKFSDRCESLAVCHLLSTVTWARLTRSGQWLPLFPTPIGLHWWLDRTPLSQHLQRRVVTHLAEVGVINSEEEAGMEEMLMRSVHKLATAIGYLLNRAFGLDPPSDEVDEEENEEDYEDEESEMEHERLRVPVRDHQGQRIEAYSTQPRNRWDIFASVLGITTLQPLNIFLHNVALFDLFLPTVQAPVPVLNEAQRELMGMVMDLLYNSCNGGNKGVLLRNYLRNPDGWWGEGNMVLGVAMEHSVVPVTHLEVAGLDSAGVFG